MELGFRIPQAIQIPLHGANVSCGLAIIVKFERQLYRIDHGRLTLYGDYCLFDRLFVLLLLLLLFFFFTLSVLG